MRELKSKLEQFEKNNKDLQKKLDKAKLELLDA